MTNFEKEIKEFKVVRYNKKCPECGKKMRREKRWSDNGYEEYSTTYDVCPDHGVQIWGNKIKEIEND